jgi:hypothetical protein
MSNHSTVMTDLIYAELERRKVRSETPFQTFDRLLAERDALLVTTVAVGIAAKEVNTAVMGKDPLV